MGLRGGIGSFQDSPIGVFCRVLNDAQWANQVAKMTSLKPHAAASLGHGEDNLKGGIRRVEYLDVVERDRVQIEVLLRSDDAADIRDALLSAAYFDPDWEWVQSQCLIFSRHHDKNVRWISAICFGHLARIHRQLDLEVVLEWLVEMKSDPLVASAANDALDDIKFYMKFQ
jgi:hypothetical protein